MMSTVKFMEHRNSLPSGYDLREFTIRKILGQGGFGITYLAHDNNLNRQVAIKEYLPMELAVREMNSSIQPVSGEHGERFQYGLERFIQEAQTLARFKHPNIVQAFSVIVENNTAYVVMNYEGGNCLDDILKKRNHLPEDELFEILLPVLDGLECIHDHGFIHRDIKPANIMIRENNNPLLLDFGSARQSLGSQSGMLTTMFTPGYAPFEQYTGKKINQGPWTDIYGLGATLYKSVTGRAPADAVARGDALLQLDCDIYVSMVEINPAGYSQTFLKAIDKALCFRPSQRPVSVSEWRNMVLSGGEKVGKTRTVTVDRAAGMKQIPIQMSNLDPESVTIAR